MKSFFTGFAIAMAAWSTLITAQSNETEIDSATKEVWCTAQVSQCPALCADSGKGTQSNICFPDNLVYECVCEGGVRPNLTEYSETIPYYLCTQKQMECIVACGSNANCEAECRKTNTCGATSPKHYNSTQTLSALQPTPTSSSASQKSSSADSSANSFDGKPSSATSSLLELGSSHSLSFMAAGLAMGVAFVGGI